MIRQRQLLINEGIFYQLKLVAEVQGMDNAEQVAEAWLLERLNSMPEIADRSEMRRKALKKADAEWLAKHKPKTDEKDELP